MRSRGHCQSMVIGFGAVECGELVVVEPERRQRCVGAGGREGSCRNVSAGRHVAGIPDSDTAHDDAGRTDVDAAHIGELGGQHRA
ncbi:Uncharacterised protein [Mycobacteroides abscessus subsp. abscessus]|nr:Uncharacterised protein [Mycobacteroides abscessus subsp. abscessus]